MRWPNVLLDGDRWLVADFELASRNGTALPETCRASGAFAPEARAGEPCTFASDVWQVGNLVLEWRKAKSMALDAQAISFTEVLMTGTGNRPSCQDALALPWLHRA